MHQRDDDLGGENIYAGWEHDLPLLEATDAEGSCSGIHGRASEVDVRSGMRGCFSLATNECKYVCCRVRRRSTHERCEYARVVHCNSTSRWKPVVGSVARCALGIIVGVSFYVMIVDSSVCFQI